MQKPGRYGIDCEFVIRGISGATVAFESVKFPSHFLSIAADGLVRLESRSLDSINVQFTLRANVSGKIYIVLCASMCPCSKQMKEGWWIYISYL